MQFTEFQKEVLKRLVEFEGDVKGFDLFLSKYYFTEKSKRVLAIEPNRSLLILLDIETKNGPLYREVLTKIIELISLIKILNSLNYISIFKNQFPSNGYFIYDFGGETNEKTRYSKMMDIKKNCESGNAILIDNDVHLLIREFFGTLIHVSPMLKEYVKDNFKTKEQVRHNQNIKIGYIGILIAIAVGLASIYVGYDKTPNSEIKDELNKLNSTISNKELPDIINTRILNDTINTKVISFEKIKNNTSKEIPLMDK